MGFDKASFEDRVAYVEDRLGEISKWVSDPLQNTGWMEIEDKWQCLAAARELISALNFDFPEDFPSNLPIYQDGTCNGLQHYAALGRDYNGGLQVNLIDQPKPGDLYSKVCQMVIQ